MQNWFLTAGLLCHGIAFFLFALQKEIYAYGPFKKIVISLTEIADHVWSMPFALVLLLMLFTPWAYFLLRVKKRGAGF